MTDQAQQKIEEMKRRRSVEAIKFPEDLGDFYLSLDFYDYRTAAGARKSPMTNPDSAGGPIRRIANAERDSVNNQIAKPSTFAQIKLPLPTNLKDNFKINYENTALGGTIGALSAIGQAGADTVGVVSEMLNLSEANNNAPSDTDIIGQFGQGALAAGKGIANYLTEKNVLFGANIGGLWDLASGTAVNPNLAVLFRGPTLKTHTFEWHLTPRTKAESDAIQKIRAIITRAMHPERISPSTSAILRFPSECLIQFVGVNSNRMFLYPLRPTVVEAASFDYAPNGIVSMFQDTHDVTAMNVSITFQETSYYTRDSFDNTNEFGADGFQTSALTQGGVDGFGRGGE